MATTSLETNLNGLFVSIEMLIAVEQILPALALLYAGIDVVASLERRPDEGTKSSFVRWTDTYLLTKGELPCTSMDLYAARCGILHTYTADSDLRRSGKARLVVYAYGETTAEALDQTAKRIGRDDSVSVHVDPLVAAFQRAVAEWFDEVYRHPERLRHIESQRGMWFTHLPKSIVDDFLRVVPENPKL